MGKGIASGLFLLFIGLCGTARAQAPITAAQLELGAFGWQPRGGARIEQKQLHLDLPADRSGSADAWLGIPLQADFSIDVEYVIEARAATVVSSSVGVVLDPGDNSPGITVDRARRGGEETLIAGRGPEEKTVPINNAAVRPAGAFRLVRRADSVEIFARDEAHRQWTSITKIAGRIPPQLSLGLTAQKAGRGEFRATIQRVALSSDAAQPRQPNVTNPPAITEKPTTSAIANAGRIGPAGGTLRVEGFQVDIPKGAMRADTELTVAPLQNPPAPKTEGITLIGDAFTISGKTLQFNEPAIVTLRYDPAKLPQGMDPKNLSPVIGRGGQYEELTRLSVNTDKHEVRFKLRRLYPRVAYEGTVPDYDEGGPVAVLLSEKYYKARLHHDGPDFQLRGAAGPDPNATIATVRQIVQRASTELERRGFVKVPPPIRIALVPPAIIAGAAGRAEGEDMIFIDQSLLGTGDTFAAVLTHEYFHLVQTLSKPSFDNGPNDRRNVHWIEESSAEWVGHWFYPKAHLPLDRLADTKPEFFHGPFFYGEETSIQPYKSFLFYSFLDAEYGAFNVLKQIYQNPIGASAETVQPITRLETIIAAKNRTLPDLLVDFMVRYSWKKDIEPVKTVLSDPALDRYAVLLRENLGKPGEIKRDTKNLVVDAIPHVEGNQRQKIRRFQPVVAEPYGIAATYDIASKCNPDEKGNLVLSVAGPSGQARIVAFPYEADGYRDPVIGNPGSPAIISNWPTQKGVLVWLMSITNEQRNSLTLEAKLADPDAPGGRWVLQGGGPKVVMPPGTTLPPNLKVTAAGVTTQYSSRIGQLGEPQQDVTYKSELKFKGPPSELKDGQKVTVSMNVTGDHQTSLAGQWLVSAVGEKQGVDYVALSPPGPNAYPTTGELTFVPRLQVLAGQPYVIRLTLPNSGVDVSIHWVYAKE